MTAWATTFLVVALVSATLAFGAPGTAMTVARIIFAVSLTAAAVTWLMSAFRARSGRRAARGATFKADGED